LIRAVEVKLSPEEAPKWVRKMLGLLPAQVELFSRTEKKAIGSSADQHAAHPAAARSGIN